MNRSKMRTVIFLKLLREEADFGEAMEKKENPVIPGKVVKAATAGDGLNDQGEGTLEGEQGRAMPKIGDS